LAFKDSGELVVIHKRDYDDDYRKPEEYEISISEFAQHKVEGVPLKDLVIERLMEILPRDGQQI
jgi:hypothetical protein